MTLNTLLRVSSLTVCGLITASSPRCALAQSTELGGLASKVAERIEKKPDKRVLVADFLGPDGNLTELGRDLGDQFSAALAHAAPSLRLLPRANLVASWNSALDLDLCSEVQEGRAARALARLASAEVVIIGSFAAEGSAFELRVRAWDIAPAYGRTEVWDPDKIADTSAKFSLTPAMAALLAKPLQPAQPGTVRLSAGLRRSSPAPPAPPPATPAVAVAPQVPLPPRVFQPGQNGVGHPTCLACPPPEPTDEARRKREGGVVILELTVTAEGNAEDIKVVKSPGYGLDQQAVEGVRGWRFKPALGPDGTPVAVRINVEVSFHFK
jgi:TonB family protein